MSGWYTPARMWMRVDLPAPFSPTIARIFALVCFQRHVGQRLDAGEGFGDTLDPEQHLLLRHRSLLAQV